MKQTLMLIPLLALAVSAQDTEVKPAARAVESVSGDRIKEYLTYLASDALEGRLAGFPGNEKAAEYIAEHAKKIGLKPLGDTDKDGNRTFFQKFTHSRRRGLSTRNIIGYIEGTDEKLKKECVVIGAHMDHVGTASQKSNPGRLGAAGKEDEIWNGADDNGSGTTTVMEVARAFTAAGIRPRRSVIFMWFSAEEWGLLGSAHYADHPASEFPIGQHAAMINLDMVGRNPDKPCAVGGMGTAAEWRSLLEAADKGTDANLRLNDSVSSGSDHLSFHRKGIPTAGFFTGFHANYHRYTDHVEYIDFARAAKIGRVALKLLVAVANRDERLKFTGTSGRGRRAPRGKRFGISGEALSKADAERLELPAGTGGFTLDTVGEGSVAEKAGLEEGDIIIRFNAETLPLEDPLRKLRRLIRNARNDTAVPVKVIRDGEHKYLIAVWGKLPEKKKGPVEY